MRELSGIRTVQEIGGLSDISIVQGKRRLTDIRAFRKRFSK